MSRQNVIDIENLSMARTYWKRPLVINRGKGAILWDINGKEYIDCTGNYGVAIVGHAHPKVVEAIKAQAEKLTSCHGTFYSEARSKFLEKLVALAPRGLERAFLSNSGAESVEFALKIARRSTGRKEIIAMMGAFHGKTMGALSATWNKKYRHPFEPLVPGFKHVSFGKIENIEKAISDETAAVITEAIQGESGVRVPPDDFLPALRELCDEREILLIVDEVQTGFGRTGRMFACEHWGIEPDILCLAKAVANGLPMGVTMTKGEIMSSLQVGEHSSTFGGGPLACAAAAATIDVLLGEKLPERAARLGNNLMERLEGSKEKYKIIREVRGLGLMIGLELRFDILNILLMLLDRGILMLDAGRNVMRFLPPLVIEEAQLDRVVSVLEEVLGEEEDAKLRR
ncbi:MAG: aspartate aminotransferase family protein [Nitrososphaeria archaeon]